MKGKSYHRHGAAGATQADAEAIAVAAFGRIVAEPERIQRFLAVTGLDPASIRAAASEPAFLPAVMDYVASDETLLIALAAELGRTPEALAAASRRLSPNLETP